MAVNKGLNQNTSSNQHSVHLLPCLAGRGLYLCHLAGTGDDQTDRFILLSRPLPLLSAYHASALWSVSQSLSIISRHAASELPWQQARDFHLFCFVFFFFTALSFLCLDIYGGSDVILKAEVSVSACRRLGLLWKDVKTNKQPEGAKGAVCIFKNIMSRNWNLIKMLC